MSGEDIPYQLRPNKFIDRQIFVEMLSRIVLSRGVHEYIYVSMGGRHMVDHYAIYNQLGVDAQYSFDQDANEVQRQLFNRPTGKTICSAHDAAALPAKIDDIFAAFPRKKNLIVWLDYTGTQRRSQLQEAIQTLLKLKHGDVFRITLNANPETLCRGDAWKTAGAASPGEFRANQLREQISEYMPTEIVKIGEDQVPTVLARCVELAAKAAEAQDEKLKITPLLITSYRDGQRMLTVTCAVSETGNAEKFPIAAYWRWKFACKGWGDIQKIQAPVFSTKEQHRLAGRLHRGVVRMLDALKFFPNEDRPKSLEALRSYREFHRFYPSFRHVEE